MGQYIIDGTPSINTKRMLFLGSPVALGDVIDVTVSDLFYGVQVDRFYTPGSPRSTKSAWKEVQRLTGLPLTRVPAVPDVRSPARWRTRRTACRPSTTSRTTASTRSRS